MILEAAQLIAADALAALSPHCERIEIAGSIRRRKADVGDIEIVCIPKGSVQTKKKGKINAEKVFVPTMGYIEAVNQWQKMKGDAWGKYTQRLVKGENENGPWCIKLDIFTANKDNWGLIFAIRTGSADYSHKVLANGWTRKGCHGVKGMLQGPNGKPIHIYEEQDLFDLIGIPYAEPIDRVYPPL